MHARGLRPRRARSMLAISHSSVSPSAHWNSVGALISDHFHGSIPCLHVPLIVTLGKVSVREISTVVVARACLWKCEKFGFADRLHWRRQASRGHEYVPLTLDVY